MKNFYTWLNEREESKKLIGRSINHDKTLVVDGGKTSPLYDIKAINKIDEEIPGNKLYLARTQSGSTYIISMDDATASNILTTFFILNRKNPRHARLVMPPV